MTTSSESRSSVIVKFGRWITAASSFLVALSNLFHFTSLISQWLHLHLATSALPLTKPIDILASSPIVTALGFSIFGFLVLLAPRLMVLPKIISNEAKRLSIDSDTKVLKSMTEKQRQQNLLQKVTIQGAERIKSPTNPKPRPSRKLMIAKILHYDSLGLAKTFTRSEGILKRSSFKTYSYKDIANILNDIEAHLSSSPPQKERGNNK